VRPGRELNVIGRVIESYAKRFGYGVVREFTGHGIGRSFHSGLVVLHYDEPSVDPVVEPGMTFTIEPMITIGAWQHRMWDDDWTAVTVDGKRTAQFEHTVLVTEGFGVCGGRITGSWGGMLSSGGACQLGLASMCWGDERTRELELDIVEELRVEGR
jgi:Xaa-Pro aminopeptidase